MAAKKRLFTGLQPSGALHIGNYFGTLKPLLEMYEGYESFLCVVDYHALTTVRDGALMKVNIRQMAGDFMALGFDPAKGTLFKQSDAPEHTELAWILNCLVSVPFLELGHAYKDAAGKGKEATAGLFTYPVLMASDIVLYDTDVVPVGEDQRQHIEYARDIASKFNHVFGETFKLPKESILKAVAVVPGTDGRKMSKSYGNTIPLFASREQIIAAVMSIVTDSTGDRPENVYAIHRLLKSEGELESLYGANKGKYKALKEALIEDLDAHFKPIRERRLSISDGEIDTVLAAGAKRAREVASAKMKEVREKIGVNL